MVIPIKDLLLRAFTGEPNKIDELKPERKFLRQKVALIMKKSVTEQRNVSEISIMSVNGIQYVQ